jgi:TonB-dependent starch-binding outer membrane protein SusC
MKRIRIILLLLFASTFAAHAQVATVSGIVYDENNAPMPAVNVVEKGTTNGTISNSEGRFTIKVSDTDAVLVFSFIGYLEREVPLEGRTELAVDLEVDVAALEEVIVVGYGTQRKSDLTGSVAVVDVDEMEKVSKSHMGAMLQGRVAGVSVTSDGQPGADPVIRIRGISTFGDASPLYVIDGVPVGGNPRDLSPNDIESLQILKDASAAAIYGSRAANGVIIITTKRGQKNTPLQVNYKGYLGIDDIWQRIPMLGRENYQTVYNYSLENNSMPFRPGNDPDSPYYITDVDTDWQEAGFKTGVRQNHNISMSGGGESGTYAVILDYLNSQGTLEGKGPDYTRYSIRTNNSLEKGIFSARASAVYTHTDQNSLNTTNRIQFSGGNPAMIIKLLQLIPTMSVEDPDGPDGWGTYDTNTQGEDYSLNIIAMNNNMDEKVTVDRMMASGYAELDFGSLLNLNNQTLKYKMNLSYDKTHVHDFSWVPAFSMSSFYTNTLAALNEGWREYTSYLAENTINYGLTAGKLNVEALIGQMFQGNNHMSVSGHGEGFALPYYKELSNAEETSSASWEQYDFLSSYLGRINLTYDDRYLMTATARRDGTSKVNRDDRFGIFPSFSLGWKIHNEAFFPDVRDVVSEVKLRGGYGKLGNSAIGPYDYLATLNRNVVYNFNNEKVTGSSQPSVVSQLVWETKSMTNIGLDMSFLKRKLDLTVEYYNSLSSDLLLQVDIPLSVGSIDNTPRSNAATVRNSGVEFLLTHRNYDNAFKYELTANFSTLKNEVIELNATGQPRYGAFARTVEGEEIGQHFGYVYNGLFQSQEDVDTSAFQTARTAAGDIKFADLNDDDVINEEDRQNLGSGLPDFTYGLNFSASYKGIDFSIFATGAAGYLVHDYMYRNLMHSGGGLNWHEDILDFWREDNMDTDIPRVVYQDPNDNFRDSDRPGWLQKGDHLKIANITIGYSLPATLIRKADLMNVRIYASVQNLYTFSNYKGYNPDFANPDPFSPGFNGGSYPVPRSYMFGIDFKF